MKYRYLISNWVILASCYLLVFITSRCQGGEAEWSLIDLGTKQHIAYLLRIGEIQLFEGDFTITERVYNIDTKQSVYYQLMIPLEACSTTYTKVRIWNEEQDELPTEEVVIGSGQVMSEIVRRVCTAYHIDTLHPTLGY